MRRHGSQIIFSRLSRSLGIREKSRQSHACKFRRLSSPGKRINSRESFYGEKHRSQATTPSPTTLPGGNLTRTRFLGTGVLSPLSCTYVFWGETTWMSCGMTFAAVKRVITRSRATSSRPISAETACGGFIACRSPPRHNPATTAKKTHYFQVV